MQVATPLAWGLLAGVIGAVSALGAGAMTTTYTSFQGDDYTLRPFDGASVSLLLPDAPVDGPAMDRILGVFDEAWEAYAGFTGRRPRSNPPYTRLGGQTATVAVVPDGATCGAGCGFLGATGIEISESFWRILESGVRESGQFDQVPFYEMGRNFWLFERELGGLAPFVTGFAIANRFVAMDAVGVSGGPFNGTAFNVFRQEATADILSAYAADERLDWRASLAEGLGVPHTAFPGPSDLAGAMLHKIYEDHGFDGYTAFFDELAAGAPAATPEAAMANVIHAAFRGTGTNYARAFKARDVAPIPLPQTAPLLGAALLALGLWGRASRRRPQRWEGCQNVTRRSTKATSP